MALSGIEVLALVLVGAAGLFLAALGAAALLAPRRASRFLLGFAGSASKHHAELAVRFMLGAAFIAAAPRLPFTAAVTLFGWVLLITTAVMLLLPWRWHQRFAARAVPQALAFLPWIGLGSAAAGLLLVLAACRGGGWV